MPSELQIRGLKLVLHVGACLGRLLYRVEIKGVNHIPMQGGCIFACNDHGAIGSFFGPYYILSRRQLESLAFLGGWGMGGGGFPLRRWMVQQYFGTGQGGRFIPGYKAQGLSAPGLLRALKLLRQEKAIILAAEGEMSWDGRLQPIQPGVAWLALRAQVPVVPIVAVGAYEILPRWTRWPRLRGKVTVRVGAPFYVSDGPYARVTAAQVETARQHIQQELAALLAQGV